MTIEQARLVRLRATEPGLDALLRDVRAAYLRAEKALPGERLDVTRYEGLSSQLERTARKLAAADDPCVVEIADRVGHSFYDTMNLADLPAEAHAAREWIAAGDIAVELRDPFTPGATPTQRAQRSASEVAQPWRAITSDGESLEGKQAVALRFSESLEAAAEGNPDAAIRPSGVANSVLTNGLRTYVGLDGPRCDVPVVYKDGSRGPDFPLRCLSFGTAPVSVGRVYHFAMLSIRHTEMDAEVDGAWLRNVDISRSRPAGDTDRLAYEISREQLAALCRHGPTLLYLYQTGLDTAVVGFYRAVTEHLISSPGSLTVIPMFFQRQPRGRLNARVIAGYEQQATFMEGRPWTT